MKIFITTMDEPYFMNPFISKILKERKNEIIGLATSKAGRLTTKRKRLDLSYACSLLLILGIINSMRIWCTSLVWFFQKKLSKIFPVKHPLSVIQIAQQMNIPVWQVESVNDDSFLTILEELKPDIIINQTQEILKPGFIRISKNGVLNRHASILPKNRGRLTPFWALFRDEKETGVTIHFVSEKIDQGDIICQKTILISPDDDFFSLTQKGYTVAGDLMLDALKKVESGKFEIFPNDPSKGNYNSTPSLMDAINYKKKRIRKLLGV